MKAMNPEIDPPSGADPSSDAARIAALEQENAALNDRLLRLVAEMQNLQRRAQREKEEALRFAEAEFAKQLVVVLDNLERAQEACQSGADAKSVADGVRIVYDQFMKVLKDHHIEPIDATGEPFDPSKHEALLHQPHDDVPPGHVIQQVSRGYQMHGRVLRPAKVIVAKEK